MLDRRTVACGVIGALNLAPPNALAQGRPVIPTNYADLLTMAREHVSALSYGHSAWGFGREEHWAVDLDRGSIEWTLPDRMVRAPAQLIGTWASDLGTYRWGWDHPSAPPGTAVAAAQVKAFADAHRLAELQVVEPACTREHARDLASIAVLVGYLQGLYIGQASRTALAFIGFGEVELRPRTG
jgi:hypothetical protein